MRRLCSGIAGIILAVTFAGCGETTVDEGPKPFKPTDMQPLEPMLKQMQEVQKSKAYTKKSVAPKEEKAKQ
jgi:hypothetical protein